MALLCSRLEPQNVWHKIHIKETKHDNLTCWPFFTQLFKIFVQICKHEKKLKFCIYHKTEYIQ